MTILNKTFMILLTATMLGASCQTIPPGPVPPAPPVVVVPSGDPCVTACAHLKSLGCAEGKPIDMHKHCHVDSDCGAGQSCSPAQECMASCEQFCADTQANGVSLDVNCAITINSCDKINSCQGN